MSYLSPKDESLRNRLNDLQAEPDEMVWLNVSKRLDDIAFPTTSEKIGLTNQGTSVGNTNRGGGDWFSLKSMNWFVAAAIVLFFMGWVINNSINDKSNSEAQTQLSDLETKLKPREIPNQLSVSIPEVKVSNELFGAYLNQTPSAGGCKPNFACAIKPKVYISESKSGYIFQKDMDLKMASVSKLMHDSTKTNGASYFYQAGLAHFWKGNYCKSHVNLAMAKTLLCNRDTLHDEVEKVIQLVENKISQDCICMIDEENWIQN